eukprot:gene6010-16005_t
MSQYRLNVPLPAKCPIIGQMYRYRPNVPISAKCTDIGRMYRYRPNVPISAKCTQYRLNVPMIHVHEHRITPQWVPDRKMTTINKFL